MLTSRAVAIKDPEVRSYIESLHISSGLYSDNLSLGNEFKEWSGVNYKGYTPYMTDGVTGAYNDFMQSYNHLKTVTFHGEYSYHRTLRATRIDHYYELKRGMKLIISDPFAASGCGHTELDAILLMCEAERIPVFVDRAFALLTGKHYSLFDEHWRCVKYIAYSFSKMFNTGRCRLGVCFKQDDSKLSQMNVIDEYKYFNNVSIELHRKLINRFGVDYLYDKYHPKQIEECAKLGIKPSETVFLGYSFDDNFKEYTREGYCNRICLSELWNLEE